MRGQSRRKDKWKGMSGNVAATAAKGQSRDDRMWHKVRIAHENDMGSGLRRSDYFKGRDVAQSHSSPLDATLRHDQFHETPTAPCHNQPWLG